MSRIITFILCFILCFNALAKKHHDDHRGNDFEGHKGYKKTDVVEKKVVVERFSDNDRDVIVKYYDRKYKKIPPGQLKKMRHVDIVVGEPAPAEVVKIFVPLPSALAPLLPPPPPGFNLYVAGDQIVRVESHSHRVVDCVPIPGLVPPPPPPPFLPVPPPPPLPR
jgi:hypothetical protein